MSDAVKPAQDGIRSVVPHLVVKGASDAIAFYVKALGATEICRIPDANGRIMHAAVQIGDSQVYLNDECPEYGSMGPQGISPVTIHLNVEDADATFAKAIEGGAEVLMPVDLMFWGDRYGQFKDPFGHRWSVSTHVEDVTPEQMKERMAAFAGAEAPCEA